MTLTPVQLFGVLIVLLFPGGRDVPLVTEAQFLTAIGDVFANPGHNATFNWEASEGSSGLTIAIISWSKDSAPIGRMVGSTFLPDIAYAGRVTQDGSAGIILINATEADEGTYECSVQFSDGTRFTESVEFQIAEPAASVWMTVFVIVLVNDTRQMEVEIGKQVTFTCNSIGGKPPPTYTFRMPDGSIVNPTTLNIVVINSFQERDVGNYSCIASNMAGDVTSESTQLIEITVRLSELPPWVWGIIVPGLIIILGIMVYFVVYLLARLKPEVKIGRSSGLEVEVQWTAKSDKCEASYKVGYRHKVSKKWIYGPEVSTNDYPNYKYTITFPKPGRYGVCVQGTFTCTCGKFKVPSDIKGVTVPFEDTAPYGGPGDDDGSSGEQNTPISPLHGNETSKNDVPLVVMITEGKSHQVKLDPIVINKQNPTEKKKKKKRQKVNKVNASDEDTKPED